jgi:hypothetical protein
VLISIYIVHVCDDIDGHKKARKTPVRPTRLDRAPIGALRATIALRSLCLFVANGLVFGGLGFGCGSRGAKYPGHAVALRVSAGMIDLVESHDGCGEFTISTAAARGL